MLTTSSLMEFARKSESSSIASTSTPGAFSNTRCPESSDNEAAVRAKAMLINSARASLCLSVSNISLLPEDGFHCCDQVFLVVRLVDKTHGPGLLGHRLSRLLYISTGNDNAGSFVHFANLSQNLQARHAFHNEVQEDDIGFIEKVFLDGDHSIFRFNHKMTGAFQNSL